MATSFDGRNRPLTVTVQETALLLGVDRRTLYYAIHRGDIPAIRVGRAVRIPTHYVEDALGHLLDEVLFDSEEGCEDDA